MDNHFHFLVKIKTKETLQDFVEKNTKLKLDKDSGLHSATKIFSKQMAKFLSCYTQSFNKVNNRHGA
jgi:putative transposase